MSPHKTDLPHREHPVIEPIAVVGLALKFPGEAEDEVGFWNTLQNGRCVSTRFPAERMNIDAFHDSDFAKQNKVSTQNAHFLAGDSRDFDAQFFSVQPQEAGAMDPQHRGLLETVYHALENAGISMESIAETDTSVHVGCFTTDFVSLQWKDSQQIPRYSATGTAASILSNRLSWFYNLRGPSMTIDTACSSSMVALDLACNGLRSRTSQVAIVAGANLIHSPELNIALSNFGMLSPDGKCYSFDSRANGYARGEGFAALILKPVSQAVRDGDSIRALIRATGTNQDGHTAGGLTQPSRELQSKLIHETYRKANLDMSETRYFEAHGTGTAAGDPVEARALGESFRTFRSGQAPLYVGAVKSNIGHLEGVSGLAGVIKSILALEKGLIPPNANFRTLNPSIDADFLNISFPTTTLDWPQGEVRRASVNSFGFGGTNAHCVIDDFPSYVNRLALEQQHCSIGQQLAPKYAYATTKRWHESDNTFSGKQLIIFSASDELGTKRLVDRFQAHFSEIEGVKTDVLLRDLAFTMNKRRSRLTWKSYALISPADLPQLASRLSKPVKSIPQPAPSFVFTGQGAQWAGMAQELFCNKVFAQSISVSQSYLSSLGCPWSIKDEIERSKEASRLGDPEYSQAVVTAIQIALVQVLDWLGVLPSTVIGHSSGEIAAAFCAGFICHESAMRIAYHRGVLAAQLSRGTGRAHGMLAVGLSRDDVQTALIHLNLDEPVSFDASDVTVSCINSTASVTLSGPVEILQALETHFGSKGIFARRLAVGVGYHSPQMLKVANKYCQLLGDLKPGVSRQKRIKMLSSVTCKLLSAGEARDGSYWVQNMVSPVQFLDATRLAIAHSSRDKIVKKLDGSHESELVTDLLIEIGPHSTLQGPIRDITGSLNRMTNLHYTSLLKRRVSSLDSVMDSLGFLATRSVQIDLTLANELNQNSKYVPRVLHSLPQYPFDHSVLHWEESRSSKDFRFRRYNPVPLLGTYLHDSVTEEPSWKFMLRSTELPWVKDHKVNGVILYPAAGMLVMAIEACKLLYREHNPTGFELKEVLFLSPIVVPDSGEGVEVHLRVRNQRGLNAKAKSFGIFVYSKSLEWTRICTGQVWPTYPVAASDMGNDEEERRWARKLSVDFAETRQSCRHEINSQALYKDLRHNVGLDYGPAFNPLYNIQFNDRGNAIANVKPLTWITESDSSLRVAGDLTIHPSTFDGLFQLAFVALKGRSLTSMSTMIPTRIGRAWVSAVGLGLRPDEECHLHVSAHLVCRRLAKSKVVALSGPELSPRVYVEELELTAVASSTADEISRADMRFIGYHMNWKLDLDLADKSQVISFCDSAKRPIKDPIEWFQNLETLLLSYGAQSLHSLDCDGASIAPGPQQYARWLQGQIETDLSAKAPEQRHQRSMLLLDSASTCQLSEDMRSSNKKGEFHVKVGERLTEILSGTLDPLEYIFDQSDLLSSFYEEMIQDSTAFDAVNAYLEALTHKTPNLKFLEIGAGTGATTRTVLSAIEKANKVPHYASYDFTDISISFFESARQAFPDRPRMNFRPLNIEQDPVCQGFEENSYDVVLASLVLHATENLEKTLRNVRRLLKPGGKLIIQEITIPSATRAGFIFGLLPGWWLGTESYRPNSACVDESRWHQLFRETSFSGIDYSFKDYAAEECHGWSVLITTAVSEAGMLATNGVPTDSLIVTDDGVETPFVQQVMTSLRAKGLSAKSVSIQPPSALEAFRGQDVILLDTSATSLLFSITEDKYTCLQTLLQTVKSITWVTGGGGRILSSSPSFGLVAGLSRVCRQENPQIPITIISLDDNTGNDCFSAKNADRIARVHDYNAHCTNSASQETEYRETGDGFEISRLYEADQINKHIFDATKNPIEPQLWGNWPYKKLAIKTPGLLDTMFFMEDEVMKQPLASDDVLIEAKAMGLNFKDCLTLLGRVNSDDLGSDACGVVTAVGAGVGDIKIGDRVLVGALNSYKSVVRAKRCQVYKIPDSMSFVEGASLPTTYGTAYYCLHKVARLQKSETIFIQAAAGGTGQAAVQMALDIGAEVFAAVGSAQKKEFLVEKLGLQEDHIFYSRDLSFVEGIRRMTNGKGVDVVLNSLSGDALQASWECIAEFGRFVEIGRKDIELRSTLPMSPFRRNATFSGVYLATVLENEKLCRETMAGYMELLNSGRIGLPHPITTYPLAEIEQAFRLLQSGRSLGKIVLSVSDTELVPVMTPTTSNFEMDPSASYVIAGGLGGIGRSISRWMVQRGARNLILLSRGGIAQNKPGQTLVEDLTAQGVQVKTPLCDITDIRSLTAALDIVCHDMPPIKGCIQATMVLRDSIFANMKYEDWSACVRPKAEGSWNLHQALPQGMEFFVMLSSVCGIFGNSGQSNYAAGNAYQDALADFRQSTGEKATALDLGIVLSEGYVANNEDVFNRLLRLGLFLPIELDDIFAMLDFYCHPQRGFSQPHQRNLVTGFELPANMMASSGEIPPAVHGPLFSHMRQIEAKTSAAAAARTVTVSDLQTNLKQTSSPDEAHAAIMAALRVKLSRMLGISETEIEQDSQVESFGVDSLVAVEIRNWLLRETSADVAVFEILGGASLSDIATTVLGKI